jgi:hypothetical protein
MNTPKFDQAKLLKVAAVAIAAPRYMGAFGSAVGLDVLDHFTWLADVEAYSGAAMALLEGFALAFVLSKWRLLKPGLHFAILLLFICLLAATLPAVAVPYLLAEQTGQQVSLLFADVYWLQVCWSFLVAGVPMLVIMAVGFADTPDEQEQLARRAKAEQTRQATRQAEQQAKQQTRQTVSKPFVCESCGERFSKQQGLNGHRAHCKAQANGKLEPELDVGEPEQNSKAGEL